MEDFCKMKCEINAALCDSVDTRTVIEKLRQLVAMGNAYINEMVSVFKFVAVFEEKFWFELKGPACVLVFLISLTFVNAKKREGV